MKSDEHESDNLINCPIICDGPENYKAKN